MILEFKLPDIGEGVHEGEIVAWHVKAGDTVAEDQPLLDVMTDKVTAEIPSPSAGTIKEIKAQPGEVVAVGTVIVTIETEGEQAEAETAPQEEHPQEQHVKEQQNKAPEKANDKQDAPPAEESSDKTESSEDATQQDAPPEANNGDDAEKKPPEDSKKSDNSPEKNKPKPDILAAPATRKLAQELGLDLSKISGTGVKGRITPDDVLKAGDAQEDPEEKTEEPQSQDKPPEESEANSEKPKDKNHSALTPTIEVWFDKPEQQKPEQQEPEPKPESAPKQDNKPEQKSAEKPAEDPNRRVPFTGIRKKIAEHLSLSKQKAPHFGYVEEADLTDLVALRGQFKQAAKDQGATLTYLPFVIKAVIEGLKAFPILNSTLDEDKQELVYQSDFNIGLAIATDNGLVVPVIKNADRLSILQLAQKIAELAEKARTNKLALDDMRGGTFTITSIGSIGGLFGIPIINYPEVGILCFNKIQKRPVVKSADPKAIDGEEQIVIRSMSYLSMTCDHRVVDGAEAAKFIAKVIQVLEHPTQLLLG